MTNAEQIEQWLEPFKQDPQKVIDDCWKHADMYSYSNPIPLSSVCTYVVNYNPGALRFLNALSKGDLKAWTSFTIIALIFITLLIIIVLVEIKSSSKDRN